MIMDVLVQGLLVDNINGSIEPIGVAVEPIDTKRMSSNATSMIAVAYTGIRKGRRCVAREKQDCLGLLDWDKLGTRFSILSGIER